MKIVKNCEYVKNRSRLKLMKIVKKLYENSEKMRVGKKPWSPKLYENREKMTKFHDITVFFDEENFDTS